ncbi:hypothetical protein [Mycolicibacterium vaccae]|uniref:hypothetical protein n=1 Tax=Mycolicibacterium vaccae TaxID=1810 RepID=UPI003D0512C4
MAAITRFVSRVPSRSALGAASMTAGIALTAAAIAAAIAVAATSGLVGSPGVGSSRRSSVVLGLPSMRNTIPP